MLGVEKRESDTRSLFRKEVAEVVLGGRVGSIEHEEASIGDADEHGRIGDFMRDQFFSEVGDTDRDKNTGEERHSKPV